MSGPQGGGEWDLIPNWVGQALAFSADGRPLGRASTGRVPEPGADPMSPVVVAFQGMVQDALGERGRPVSAVYGERVLSLVPGRRVHVATVARGRPDPRLRASMEEAVARIEDRWGDALDHWSGDLADLGGLAGELAPVVGRTADRSPGEVADPLNTRGVFPVSSVDFRDGMARVKVALFSAGFLELRGGFMELSFQRESLRFEGAEPAYAWGDGDRVRLPTVPPGEASTVACLLEPLAPGRHRVEGTLTFYDDANNPRHLEVPPREFKVLFPALSVAAPVHGLPAGGWPGADGAVRTWSYPASLGGMDVLRVSRTVLGTRGLVLTSGKEEEGPPREWKVEGRAMAGSTPLVVTLRVTGGTVRRVQVSVYSSDGAVTAGAVAELRKLMEEAFFRRWRGQVDLVEEVSRPLREEGPPPTDMDDLITMR